MTAGLDAVPPSVLLVAVTVGNRTDYLAAGGRSKWELGAETATGLAVLLLVRARSRRLLLDPQLQILGTVVVTYPVLVMHLLMREEEATEDLLHNEAVLAHIGPTGTRPGMVRRQDKYVATTIDLPARFEQPAGSGAVLLLLPMENIRQEILTASITFLDVGSSSNLTS
jgi:hypothetical protein